MASASREAFQKLADELGEFKNRQRTNIDPGTVFMLTVNKMLAERLCVLSSEIERVNAGLDTIHDALSQMGALQLKPIPPVRPSKLGREPITNVLNPNWFSEQLARMKTEM